MLRVESHGWPPTRSRDRQGGDRYLLLGESSFPVIAFLVLLDDVEQDVSALHVPGAGCLVNLLVEDELERVGLAVGLSATEISKL